MKEYGLILVGSGAGLNVVDSTLERGLRVAIVEEGPIGGTCLNRGCIPSKLLIHPADVIRETEAAAKIGLTYRLEKADFAVFKKRMWDLVLSGRREIEESIKRSTQVDLYPLIGEFVGDYTMKVGEETITAPRVVLASGARASIPAIPGLDKVKFHTYRTIFDVEQQPKSVIIIGGGYIGCEFAHFFSAIGTRTTLLQKGPTLLPQEEPETSALVKKRLSEYVQVHADAQVLSVEGKEGSYSVTVKDPLGTHSVEGELILVATGIQSNADWLKPERTGVKTDREGWIVVDEHLETSKKNIYALGDALGKYQFRHTANYESGVVRHNLFESKKEEMDYHAVPHAVFTLPQVGAVGMTEAQAVAQKNIAVMVGTAKYHETAMGFAYGDLDAFVKVVVDFRGRRILGATVVGPQASTLIMQIVIMMNAESQDYAPLARSQVIHPTLSEAIADAFGRLRPVNFRLEHEHHHEEGATREETQRGS